MTTRRPLYRTECSGGPRPCPLVGCFYNLYLNVGRDGHVKLTHPGREPEDVPLDESCVLDVADLGPHTLEHVGNVLGLTRERVRQIEQSAGTKMKGKILKLNPEWFSEEIDGARER